MTTQSSDDSHQISGAPIIRWTPALDELRALSIRQPWLWRSAELTHLCPTKLTQWFKAGGGAFSFQVVEGVAV